MKAIKKRIVECLMEYECKAEKEKLSRSDFMAIDYYCELLKKAQRACRIIYRMKKWEEKEKNESRDNDIMIETVQAKNNIPPATDESLYNHQILKMI